MIDDILDEAELKMDDAVEHTKDGFSKIRTGRANPQLLTGLRVDYYGASTPLQQLAGITAPEARMLLIAPYDASSLRDIEKAIMMSDLGLNPSNDGSVIRVILPELTEERRKQYVKLARERAEDGRIAVRNARRSAKSDLESLESEGEISEDELRRAEDDLQKRTDAATSQIDTVLKAKEAELLEV
ncbi:ribosome recycling factor [Euzebya tangerina]|uniref:ribosome recycling factor n=1 Tax=Euzebya tangerina TaxID=591198 RepID=UPI000E312408|nr:ribosome recycling factor [Euzebya tangerina]